MQAAACGLGQSLQIFSPAKVRQALRQAGNIVKPADIDEVLMYAISDGNIADLDKLYLVLLQDQSVQQLHYGLQSPAQQECRGARSFFSAIFSNKEQRFFVPGRSAAIQKMCSLMEDSKHKLVVESPAWRKIAG